MEFKLPPKKLSVLILKGQIGEKVCESYINDVSIPKLESEGRYTRVVYWPANREDFETDSYATRRDRCTRPFLFHGMLPTPATLARFETLLQLLRTIPDGFLFKTTRTGKTHVISVGLKGLGLSASVPLSFRRGGSLLVPEPRLRLDSQVEEVEAEIEFVEVKTDSGDFRTKQAQDYTEALKAGFHLRVFAVRIGSLQNNSFDIAEVEVKGPD